MKKALAILIITLMVSAQIIPYFRVKADTIDLSTLQNKIQEIDTLVATDQQLFKQSLGLATALSMRQTGYEAPETSAIEDIGDWVWDRIHDIGDGTRDVAQWVVDRISDIVDGMHPHSSGGHRFTYNPSDAPLYNSLYTDDDWNQLVSEWAQIQTHDDNYISFDDVTDDIEGYSNEIYSYLDGTTVSNRLVDVQAMTPAQRSDWLDAPSMFSITTNNSLKYIYMVSHINQPIGYLVYKKIGTYYYCYLHWTNGSDTQSLNTAYNGLGASDQKSWLYDSRDIVEDGTDKRVYAWYSSNVAVSLTNPQIPAQMLVSTGFNEATASTNVYNWYHQSQYRVFNIYCYYTDDGTTLIPFSVHPGTHTEWDAPTQTPIIINNTRSYISVTNNTTITDYTTVYNNVTNNNIDNSTVVQNIFNQNTIYYVLPAPIYIESPQPTPEPITPIPTASPTPTDGPVDPSLTPTPINVQPIIPWPTGLPVTPPPESDIPVPGSEVNPIPSDIPTMNIDIPSLASLTSDGQIQNTVLVNDEGNDVDNDDIVQDLFDVIPGEDDRINLQLILFGLLFVGIVVTYLTK